MRETDNPTSDDSGSSLIKLSQKRVQKPPKLGKLKFKQLVKREVSQLLRNNATQVHQPYTSMLQKNTTATYQPFVPKLFGNMQKTLTRNLARYGAYRPGYSPYTLPSSSVPFNRVPRNNVFRMGT